MCGAAPCRARCYVIVLTSLLFFVLVAMQMGVVGSHYSSLSENERMELLRDAANQLIGKEKMSLLEPELYGPGEVSQHR